MVEFFTPSIFATSLIDLFSIKIRFAIVPVSYTHLNAFKNLFGPLIKLMLQGKMNNHLGYSFQ